MICSICGKTLSEDESKFPNSAWPIKEHENPCCDCCHLEIVRHYDVYIRSIPVKSHQERAIQHIRKKSIEDLRLNVKVADIMSKAIYINQTQSD
jgi:hypothetical protein